MWIKLRIVFDSKICYVVYWCIYYSVANAKQKLKEKTDSLKKTEMTYKKDEAVCETIKKSLTKLEVVFVIFSFHSSCQC